MKRFRFPLQTLLDIKKQREEGLKRAFAEKNGQIMRAQRELEENRAALARFQDHEKRQRTAAPTAQGLRLSVVYRYKLQRDIAGARQAVALLQQEARIVLQSLTEAKKECRALEILKEKKWSRWKRDNKREEQEAIDDISQKGYIRKTRNAAVPG